MIIFDYTRIKDLSTRRLFYKCVPDDKYSNTQYGKQEHRQRDRDRDTDRQTDRQRDRDKYRYRETDRLRDRQTERQRAVNKACVWGGGDIFFFGASCV